MNIELSKKNHMIWGYNNVPWTVRTSPYDKFYIEYGTISKTISFRQACIDTAIEISDVAKKNNKMPLILFSGGIDSEAIIYSFMLSNRDFEIAHIRYNPGINNHEYFYVDQFVKKHNLNIKIYDVNVYDFLSNEDTLKIAHRDNSIMIELQLLTCITKEIKNNFFPILDHPGTYLYRELPNIEEPAKWFFKDFEHLMFYYNHCLNEKMHACPSFFHWSPEIIYAFLTDTLIDDLINNRIPGKITNRTSTFKFYQNTFPEFDLYARPKFTGHEFISKSFLEKINVKLYQERKYDRYSGYKIDCFDLIDKLQGNTVI